MKIIDISVTISNSIPVWPGDPQVHMQRISKIEDGRNTNVSEISMSVHTGTHVDAPYHFFTDGITIERLVLDKMVGETQVIHLPDSCELIDKQVLSTAGINQCISRLLIRTRNSAIWARNEPLFQTDFVGISPDGAEYLVEKGIQFVGLDYLSVAPYKKSRPTHEVLLSAGVVALEGVNLTDVEAGIYQMVCLPLKLAGSDGAPARVILMTRD